MGPQWVIIKVNEYDDTVKFLLSAIRGDGKNIFWAGAGNYALHIHRQLARGLEEFEMTVSLIGDGCSEKTLAALHCERCGLRVIITQDGLSAEELRTLFQQWNPDLPVIDNEL